MKFHIVLYWALLLLLNIEYNDGRETSTSTRKPAYYLYMTPFPVRKPLNRSSTITISSSITPTYYKPNPGYDAYWTGGHWIFGTTTTAGARTTSTRTRILVCNKPCPIAYRNIGPVCAHRADSVDTTKAADIVQNNYKGRKPTDRFPDDKIKLHFKEFITYCHFLQAQCRDKIWNGHIWVFIHVGKCIEDEEIVLDIDSDKAVFDRKAKTLEKYVKHMNDMNSMYTKSKISKYVDFVPEQ
ncbi:uncharacterized protein LOC125232672 [Leguminivora glycinivorella]|uniref:uncharacterized protein LOC125232672 n=1 Tax=Leguminivora glycinivorella TaxID=1035111 RepID=UPI00200E54D0|nr:uncharacterized protein LOC125232672 [Leguminivora glycinivorella]